MSHPDDPVPQPTSPLWRAWQGTSTANRLLAGGAVVVALAVGAGVLLTGGDEDEPVARTTTAAASASPSVSATPSVPSSPSAVPSPSVTPSATPAAPSPSASAVPAPSSPAPTPSATAAPPAAELVLNGDDLGVTRVGAPSADAVRAVTAALGPPLADPSPVSACVGAGEREVEWSEFRLAVTDGVVSGWVSTDAELSTPSGVGIGTTVTEMQERYGDRLVLYDATPDSGPGFTVTGVQLGGALTGPGGDDRVTSFWNRACSPP